MKKLILAATLSALGATVAASALAQQTIKIANIVELSGAGTTSGTNFKNGVELAVKEINAAGGILGKKIETTTSDTQSNPGVAKGLTQKAVDQEVFAVFGPVFSGSIMESRSVDTLNPDWQQDVKFDITLLNLPPASKLCCSIHFHRRRTPLLVSVS